MLAVSLLLQPDFDDFELHMHLPRFEFHCGNFAAEILRALIELEQCPPDVVAALVSLHWDYSLTVRFIDNTYDWPWSPDIVAIRIHRFPNNTTA